MGGRVLISRDDDWRLLFFSFNYSPLSVPLVRWLSWQSPHVRIPTSSRFPKIGRQAGRQQLLDGTERASDIIRLTTHPFA